MNPEEFDALARVEREHWFYRGKRDIVRHWLRRLTTLQPDDLVIDVGAGTGQLMAELNHQCRVLGVEPDARALQIAASRRLWLVQGSVSGLPVEDRSAAVITVLDVLEHVDDDVAAVAELARATRPGGLILINVPAFESLWSDWDDALGHRRRYTTRTLLAAVRHPELTVRRCVYVNTAAFPPILAYRWFRRRFGTGRRWEDGVPAPAVNRVLHALFVWPACWEWFSPPFGVSVFCVLQRGA